MSKEQQEARRAQMESMQDSANINQAQAMAPDFGDRREYLEAVIKDELDDATVKMLKNVTSPDFILSNLNDAEITEIKKLREITLKKVYAAHPHPKAIMQGQLREDVYENGTAAKPLTQDQKILIDQYVRGAFARVARSRDGFQQEQFGKTISASEIKDRDNDNGGWLSFS